MVKKGRALCLVSLVVASLLLYRSKLAVERSDFAYVFYATQDIYACSVAVNVYLLKQVFNTKYRIVVLLSSEVSSLYRSYLQGLGASIVDEEPISLHKDTIPYYHGCLLKLASFRMHEIDGNIKRVLVLDADQLIKRNLDHLFTLPSEDFLAPTAYWIDPSFFSSTLMLIEPSPRQWHSVQHVLLNALPQQYDMDMINVLFKDSNHLPGRYATLNSHWEDMNTPSWFNKSDASSTLPHSSTTASDQDLDELYREAEVIHFSAVGKPWSYTLEEVRSKRLGAHELFFEQWHRWRTIALSVCPAGTITHV